MLIQGLYEVAIPVRQLERAETFYRDVLGARRRGHVSVDALTGRGRRLERAMEMPR